MARLRQTGNAEADLARGLSEVDRRDGPAINYHECPSGADLRLFAEGECNYESADAILAHLGSCEHCTALLRRIRIRRQLLTRSYIALAASAAILLVAWFSLPRPSSIPAGIATIDLRLISPTRGAENRPERAFEVRRTAGGLRLVLPIGSEGKYECEILRRQEQIVLARGWGVTSLENHDVVLNLPIKLANLQPGHYSLALHEDGSEWVYYPVDLR